MKRLVLTATLSLSVLALAGCGYSTGDRAASGAGLGALAGAGIGAMTGSWATGALIGGAVGGVGGAVTSPDTINLGKPLWR